VRARTALVGALAAGIAALPAVALACPACATRSGPGTGAFVLMGAMIGVPYLVAAVAFRVVRRLAREDDR
jgi:hypothetical protein